MLFYDGCSKYALRCPPQVRDVRGVRGPRQRAPLWRGQLRGLQGLLQEVDEEGPGVQVPARQGLRRQQELQEPVSVLPPAEVPRHGDAQRQ